MSDGTRPDVGTRVRRCCQKVVLEYVDPGCEGCFGGTTANRCVTLVVEIADD